MLRLRSTRLVWPMVALALTCVLGWGFKAHCGAWWSDSEQYVTGCYSDALPFWTARGVAAGQAPYFEARLEYPVLTGALIWVEGGAARLVFGAQANALAFLTMVALANALIAGLVFWMMARAGIDSLRLWGWALAPPLILYLGHNWDMLAVGFAVASLLLARERRLAAAAACAGLGMAAKLWPVLILPLLGLQALCGEGDRRTRLIRAAQVVGGAIGGWALVNLPVAWLAFDNWAEFYRFSSLRSGTAASVWELLGAFGIWSADIAARNLWSAITFVAGAGLIVTLGWRRHSDRLWVLATPLLAWFLLTSKVWSPQFDLWLYPLLLLTAPRLVPVALFALADIAAYFAEFWWFAGFDGAVPAATQTDIAIAAGARATVMLWLIADSLRRPAPGWISRTASSPASARTGR